MWPFNRNKPEKLEQIHYTTKDKYESVLETLDKPFANNKFCPSCKKEVPKLSDIEYPVLVLIDDEYHLLCGSLVCEYFME